MAAMEGVLNTPADAKTVMFESSVKKSNYLKLTTQAVASALAGPYLRDTFAGRGINITKVIKDKVLTPIILH